MHPNPFLDFISNDGTSQPVMESLSIEASSTGFCGGDAYWVRDLPCIWWDFMLSAVGGGLYVSNKSHQLDCHTAWKGGVTG